jgi:hypothetical protein
MGAAQALLCLGELGSAFLLDRLLNEKITQQGLALDSQALGYCETFFQRCLLFGRAAARASDSPGHHLERRHQLRRRGMATQDFHSTAAHFEHFGRVLMIEQFGAIEFDEAALDRGAVAEPIEHRERLS